MNNLNNLLQVLLENEIDFVLIGGFAGVVHGSTQVTRDLDICTLTDPKDISNLRNIYLETDLGVLDIISEVTEVGDFEQVKHNSVEIQLFGHKCKVISIEALIKAKEKMGRPKDKLVVAELKALHRK